MGNFMDLNLPTFVRSMPISEHEFVSYPNDTRGSLVSAAIYQLRLSSPLTWWKDWYLSEPQHCSFYDRPLDECPYMSLVSALKRLEHWPYCSPKSIIVTFRPWSTRVRAKVAPIGPEPTMSTSTNSSGTSAPSTCTILLMVSRLRIDLGWFFSFERV